MNKFLLPAFGGATGTLVYTGLISSAHELDWGRAIFVGLAIGMAALLWPPKKPQ